MEEMAAANPGPAAREVAAKTFEALGDHKRAAAWRAHSEAARPSERERSKGAGGCIHRVWRPPEPHDNHRPYAWPAPN